MFLLHKKTLREDRTAADKKHVAYCDPPQAENLAGEILFYGNLCQVIFLRKFIDFFLRIVYYIVKSGGKWYKMVKSGEEMPRKGGRKEPDATQRQVIVSCLWENTTTQ